MTAEQNIEKSLRALSAHTPAPALDMERLNKGIEKHKKLISITKLITTAAAAIVLIAGAVLVTSAIMRNQAVSTVTLDANTSLTLSLNKNGEVVDITAADQRGKKALAGFDRTSNNAEVVTAELISHLIENGTLSEYDNTVLLTADSEDDEQEDKLRAQVAEAIEEAYADNHFDGALLSQTDDDNKEAGRIASRYHVSRGKAQLLRELITADNTMSYRSLSRLNTNDLNLIADSIQLSYNKITESGTSSSLRYLKENEAIRIVIDHLGEDEVQIGIRLDARDGELLYRLSVKAGKTVYTYNLVASSGEIITVIKSGVNKTEILVDRKSRTATADDSTPSYTPSYDTPITTPVVTPTAAPEPTAAVEPSNETAAAQVPTEAPTAPPTVAPTSKPSEGGDDDAVPSAVSFTAKNYYRIDADLMAAGFVVTTPPEDSTAIPFKEIFNDHVYGENPQKLYRFDCGTAAVICSKAQLDRFMSDYGGNVRFDATAYNDSYFNTHALVLTYYKLYNMDYDFTITDMVKDGSTLYVNTSMSTADELPTTAYSAHDLVVFEINRNDLSADTQLSLY